MKALRGYLQRAMGLRIKEMELVKAVMGGFVLAVEDKAKAL